MVAAGVSFFTSLVIEGAQLLFWLGSFQLSDLFHNTLGGVIGWALWHVGPRLLKAVRKGKR